MTTYDRYLLLRYFHIVVVFFIAAVGLFAIVDGFTNLDSFQEKIEEDGKGTFDMFLLIAEHYTFQSLFIIDLAGPSIVVIAAISVLALMLKSGEVHPVLAAGIPTYRATFALVIGVLIINGLLIANQELVLPSIAPKLQRRHGQTADDAQKVDPQFDSKWKIFVTGEGVYPAEKRLHKPEFRLPAPVIALDFVTLRAEDALYLPPDDDQPGGWLLKNISPPIQEIPLSQTGREVVVPQPNGVDVFVNCQLTFNQLSRKTSNHRLVGTPRLVQRLQEPYGSVLSRRGILMHLHTRLTRPFLSLVGVFIVIPLIIRRDRMSRMQQVTNIAVCMLVLGVVYGLSMGSGYLGQVGVLRAEQAAWLPVIGSGTFASWLSGIVRT